MWHNKTTFRAVIHIECGHKPDQQQQHIMTIIKDRDKESENQLVMKEVREEKRISITLSLSK